MTVKYNRYWMSEAKNIVEKSLPIMPEIKFQVQETRENLLLDLGLEAT